MIFLLGILLGVLIALAVRACWKADPSGTGPRAGPRRRPGRRAMVGYAALAAALGILLLRPDEHIEQTIRDDAGAYFLSALSYSARQRLIFPDPALADLSPAERPLFRYGHPDYLPTKDAVLLARDQQWSRVGPIFPPAYSILLSVPASLGLTYAIFWFSPVFAILIGGLLGLLAFRLTGKQLAGWLAFALFILNPVVIWNARCLRAEWPASVLLLAGLTLWLARDVQRIEIPPGTAFLAGLAAAAACWFHILSFYVLIPMVLISLWQSRRTAFWSAWWTGLLLGVGVFLAQVIWIADPYNVKVVWSVPGIRNHFLAGAGLVLIAVLGLRRLSHRPRRFSDSRREKMARLTGALFSLGYLLATLLILRYRDDRGMLPRLPFWAGPYHSLTDFVGVIMMFSRVWLAAALAGLIVLCIRPGTPGRIGRRLFLVLAPASLLIGWVDNYMFETRRMITVLTPLFILSTTVLLFSLGGRLARRVNHRWPRRPTLARMAGLGLPCLMGAALLAGAFRGRARLYTTWNNRSTYRFYRDLAGEAREAGDFLMAEYTQTAAALERLSRLPMLPIAWGYRTEEEYREAEPVLARLVREHPERRHLLISPFSGAAVPGVGVEPLFTRTLETSRLARARHYLPGLIPIHRMILHLYRLHPPGRADCPLPYLRIMNRGQLGLSGGANYFPSRWITLRGLPLGGEKTAPVTVKLPERRGPGSMFLVVGRPDRESGQPLEVGVFPDRDGPVRQFSLGPGWTGLELKMGLVEEPEVTLEIRSPPGAYLTDIFWVDDSEERVRRARTTAEKEEFPLENTDTRWLRASAAVTLPVGPSPRWLWFLASHEREATIDVRATIRQREGPGPAFDFPMKAGWKWRLVPIDPAGQSRFEWFDLEINPPWDPELRNYPDDLGIRLHLLTVVTADQ